jgi:diaminobutyrate-2-oxoglutarate transaminase
VVNVGHCNEFVLEYVRRQQENLIHALDFPTENKVQLIEKILEQLPEKIRGDFKVGFTGPTGSDAIEASVKLAKLATGRSGLVAFYGSYHGMSSGALSLTSNLNLKSGLGSMIPDVHFIPYGYCYRCPLGLNKNSCKMACIRQFEELLENPHSGIQKPAAVLIEPIQGEGGVVIAPDGYLEKLVELAHRHDVVVIFDEIQAGFFRTGKFLSSFHTQAVPDIYTLSKGIGGLGFPLAAIVYNKRIEKWQAGKHIGTFRGNQVSIAAGNGAFDFVQQTGLPNHVTGMEVLMKERLTSLMNEFPFIGDVRGKGLFFGVEYVQDPTGKKPDSEIVREIRKRCFQRGLMFEVGGHYNNVIRLLPPLVITSALINRSLEIFEEVNREMADMKKPQAMAV